MLRPVKAPFDHEVGAYFVLGTNGKMSNHLKKAVKHISLRFPYTYLSLF